MMRPSIGPCRYSGRWYSFFSELSMQDAFYLTNLLRFLSFPLVDEISGWRADYILSMHQMWPQVFRELRLYRICKSAFPACLLSFVFSRASLKCRLASDSTLIPHPLLFLWTVWASLGLVRVVLPPEKAWDPRYLLCNFKHLQVTKNYCPVLTACMHEIIGIDDWEMIITGCSH